MTTRFQPFRLGARRQLRKGGNARRFFVKYSIRYMIVNRARLRAFSLVW